MHGGLGPIVGDIIDDGKSRAAIGAVRKWITKPAVCRIEDFRQA
jgi:hypothetical protein